MLLENVGHRLLHGALHLPDRMTGELCPSTQAVPALLSWVPEAHVPADAGRESENRARGSTLCTLGLVGSRREQAASVSQTKRF